MTLGGGHNLIGQDLFLGALQDNGGPTPTVQPRLGSPLIDAGSDAATAATLTTDQRGGGFARSRGAAIDVGAFEVQGPQVFVEKAAGQADPTNSSPLTFHVSFSEDVSGFDDDLADVSFAGSTLTGLSAQIARNTAADYVVTVTGAHGTGTVVVSVPTGAATGSGGGISTGSFSIDNTVQFDDERPAVTIRPAAGPGPVAGTAVAFDVVFSEPVIHLNPIDPTKVDFGHDDVVVASSIGDPLDWTVTPGAAAGTTR